MSDDLKKELLTFGVTEEQCGLKIQEHAENCGDIHMVIAKFKTESIDCSEANKIVYKLAIESLEEQLQHQRRQIRKWKLYSDTLQGVERKTSSIDESDIENARLYDLVSLIGQDIELKKSGSTYTARCPFHQEDTPSFIIKNNTYYCFGCKEHGDSIDWLTKYRGMGFIDAVKFLSH